MTRQELLNVFNRVGLDKSQLQKFVDAFLSGEFDFDRHNTSDIEHLTDEECESLNCGDILIKHTDVEGVDMQHCYRVSFKCATGMCLTYVDCDNVETIAYDKGEDGWSFTEKRVTNISGE